MTETANYNLVVPEDTLTGLQVFELFNSNMDIIDAHDHVANKIPAEGLTITKDLKVNSHSLSQVGYLSFSPHISGARGSFHFLDGDFYIRDGESNFIKVTTSTGFNSSFSGGIGGDYGVSPSFIFTDEVNSVYSFFTSLDVYSDIVVRSVILDNSTTTLTISSTGDYNLVLPSSLPVSKSIFIREDEALQFLTPSNVTTTEAITIDENGVTLSIPNFDDLEVVPERAYQLIQYDNTGVVNPDQAVCIPTGDESQRVDTPNSIRFNIESNEVEAFLGGSWVTMLSANPDTFSLEALAETNLDVALSTDKYLTFDGSSWVDSDFVPVPWSSVSDKPSDVTDLSLHSVLDFSNIDGTGLADGQVLKYSGGVLVAAVEEGNSALFGNLVGDIANQTDLGLIASGKYHKNTSDTGLISAIESNGITFNPINSTNLLSKPKKHSVFSVGGLTEETPSEVNIGKVLRCTDAIAYTWDWVDLLGEVVSVISNKGDLWAYSGSEQYALPVSGASGDTLTTSDSAFGYSWASGIELNPKGGWLTAFTLTTAEPCKFLYGGDIFSAGAIVSTEGVKSTAVLCGDPCLGSSAAYTEYSLGEDFELEQTAVVAVYKPSVTVYEPIETGDKPPPLLDVLKSHINNYGNDSIFLSKSTLKSDFAVLDNLRILRIPFRDDEFFFYEHYSGNLQRVTCNDGSLVPSGGLVTSHFDRKGYYFFSSDGLFLYNLKTYGDYLLTKFTLSSPFSLTGVSSLSELISEVQTVTGSDLTFLNPSTRVFFIPDKNVVHYMGGYVDYTITSTGLEFGTFSPYTIPDEWGGLLTVGVDYIFYYNVTTYWYTVIPVDESGAPETSKALMKSIKAYPPHYLQGLVGAQKTYTIFNQSVFDQSFSSTDEAFFVAGYSHSNSQRLGYNYYMEPPSSSAFSLFIVDSEGTGQVGGADGSPLCVDFKHKMFVAIDFKGDTSMYRVYRWKGSTPLERVEYIGIEYPFLDFHSFAKDVGGVIQDAYTRYYMVPGSQPNTPFRVMKHEVTTPFDFSEVGKTSVFFSRPYSYQAIRRIRFCMYRKALVIICDKDEDLVYLVCLETGDILASSHAPTEHSFSYVQIDSLNMEYHHVAGEVRTLESHTVLGIADLDYSTNIYIDIDTGLAYYDNQFYWVRPTPEMVLEPTSEMVFEPSRGLCNIVKPIEELKSTTVEPDGTYETRPAPPRVLEIDDSTDVTPISLEPVGHILDVSIYSSNRYSTTDFFTINNNPNIVASMWYSINVDPVPTDETDFNNATALIDSGVGTEGSINLEEAFNTTGFTKDGTDKLFYIDIVYYIPDGGGGNIVDSNPRLEIVWDDSKGNYYIGQRTLNLGTYDPRDEV